MTQGRKKLAPAEQVGPEYVGATPRDLALPEAASNQRLATLAKSLHYEGALREDALEDDIRFHQHRSAESIFEIGKRLLLLKELAGHGRFQERLEALGMHYRSAARFMAVALKFSKSDNLSLLSAAGNQSKLLELTVLDDEELSALEAGEMVGTLNLDKLGRMSHSELRAEIRKLKNKIEQDGKRAAERETTIDTVSAELAESRRVLKRRKPDATGKSMLIDITDWIIELRSVGSQVGSGLIALLEHGAEHDLDYHGDVVAKANDAANVLLEILNQARMAGVEEPWQRIADLVGEG